MVVSDLYSDRIKARQYFTNYVHGNSHAIAYHNADEWNNRITTSAMRLSESSIPGVNSLNHVAFPATVCNLSCESVASVAPLKYSLWWDAMNLKTNAKVIITQMEVHLINDFYIQQLHTSHYYCDRKTNKCERRHVQINK